MVEFIEKCRSSNGRSTGAAGAAPKATGGRRVIFPKGAVVPKVKLKAIEKDAVKRLKAAGQNL